MKPADIEDGYILMIDARAFAALTFHCSEKKAELPLEREIIVGRIPISGLGPVGRYTEDDPKVTDLAFLRSTPDAYVRFEWDECMIWRIGRRPVPRRTVVRSSYLSGEEPPHWRTVAPVAHNDCRYARAAVRLELKALERFLGMSLPESLKPQPPQPVLAPDQPAPRRRQVGRAPQVSPRLEALEKYFTAKPDRLEWSDERVGKALKIPGTTVGRLRRENPTLLPPRRRFKS